jgi:DNA-binding NtrC family response regulator
MAETTRRALIVDDEPDVRRSLEAALRRFGLRCDLAADGVEAIGLLSRERFDVVLTDLRMPRADGFAVIQAVRQRCPATPTIVITGQGSIADAVTALRAGACNFLNKPYHAAELAAVVEEALRGAADRDDEDPPRLLPPDVEATGARAQPQVAILGDSPRLRAALECAATVAPTEATVLLTGETGTGKEVVARLIHGLSRRAGGPFVAVNCGALPEGIVESELFGHSRGAFTGAVERRLGRFQRANGGTLFLDEVGELSLFVQVKLLRVLQEREVTPVGEETGRAVDVRVIAATHRDLEAMVAAGTFRQDLFYRLSVVPVEMPALRDRAEDVEVLARYFVESAGRRYGREITLGEDVLGALRRYSWPGNVRELENLMDKLVILARGTTIAAADLPAKIRNGPIAGPTDAAAIDLGEEGLDLVTTLGTIENRLIDQALERTGGNRNRAAALLGLNRTTLVEKLKRRGR